MKTSLLVTAILLVLILAFLLLVSPVHASDPSQDGTASPVQSAQPYAIGWGTLTLINAGIAQGKNRKGLNWWLLSIPLGPIATLLLVAFFPKLP